MASSHKKAVFSKQLLQQPDDFPLYVDFDALQVAFVGMNREDYLASVFLDDRVHRSSDRIVSVELKKVLGFCERYYSSQCSANYLFHTAYCCSTLLSRLLDRPRETLVYREPIVLTQLAMASRDPSIALDASMLKRSIRALHFLLSRSYGEEVPVIKPSDSCNNIIAELMGASKNSRALLMYSSLQSFILSNLKSPERRNFLFTQFLQRAKMDAASIACLSSINTETLSAGQSAAFVWLVQMLHSEKAIVRAPKSIYSMDADSFLSCPERALHKINALFGLGFDDASLADILQADAFRKHSKNAGTDYGIEQRADEKEKLAAEWAGDIKEGVAWVESIGVFGVGQVLSNALL